MIDHHHEIGGFGHGVEEVGAIGGRVRLHRQTGAGGLCHIAQPAEQRRGMGPGVGPWRFRRIGTVAGRAEHQIGDTQPLGQTDGANKALFQRGLLLGAAEQLRPRHAKQQRLHRNRHQPKLGEIGLEGAHRRLAGCNAVFLPGKGEAGGDFQPGKARLPHQPIGRAGVFRGPGDIGYGQLHAASSAS